MDSLRQLCARFAGLFRRRKLEAEMAEEMRQHLERRIQEKITEGMALDDARYAAQREFGGIAQVQERCRDERRFGWLEELVRDVRYAARTLRKSPAFAAVAVLSLALGIGANTALFSLIDDVLLRPQAVSRPQELVLLWWLAPDDGLIRSMDGTSRNDPGTGLRTSTSMAYPVYERLRDHHGGALRDLAAFAEIQQFNVGLDGLAEIRSGQAVTGNFFSVIGVGAARGRMLTPEDDRPGAPPVAVISHRFWQERFGGRDDAIGRTIRLNTSVVTIVGVLPPEFESMLQFGSRPSVTVPMSLHPDQGKLRDPRMWWAQVIGRLPSGGRAEQAQARLQPLFLAAAREAWTAWRPADPVPEAPLHLRLGPGAQGLQERRRDHARSLLLLTGIVALVLVIACTNVASLLLARATVRTREIAVRLSLGATRGRIVRQLLAENLVLALLGGALGVLVAHWGRDALLHLRPIGADSLALDLRVLAFTLGASLLTGALFGLAPAWLATRVTLNTALKAGSGGVGPGRLRLRHGIMVTQVALSVVLLAAAGLFLRTLHNLRSADAGFRRENLILFRVDAGLSGYDGPRLTSLFDRVQARLEELPGVNAVALSRHPLLSGSQRTAGVRLEREPPAGRGARVASVNLVSPSFLPTLEIPLLLGRNFTAQDHATAPRVAIVNASFARTWFPDENPLGRRVSLGTTYNAGQSLEIVGVARDAFYQGVRQGVPATIYTPLYQEPARQVNFTVRVAGAAPAMIEAIRAAVAGVDSDVPLFDVRTQEAQVGMILAEERLFAWLSAFFGGVALLLTCIGLYGLLAQQVAARTREIGIRLALGAPARTVLGLVLRGGLKLAALGVALGLAAAVLLTRLVSRLLFAVHPLDPLSLLGAGLLLVAVALVAAWIPARRAAKVDPMVALRCE